MASNEREREREQWNVKKIWRGKNNQFIPQNVEQE